MMKITLRRGLPVSGCPHCGQRRKFLDWQVKPQWEHLNGLLPLVCPMVELKVDDSGCGEDKDDDDGSEPSGAEKFKILVHKVGDGDGDGDGDASEGDERLTKNQRFFQNQKKKVAKESSMIDGN